MSYCDCISASIKAFELLKINDNFSLFCRICISVCLDLCLDMYEKSCTSVVYILWCGFYATWQTCILSIQFDIKCLRTGFTRKKSSSRMWLPPLSRSILNTFARKESSSRM